MEDSSSSSSPSPLFSLPASAPSSPLSCLSRTPSLPASPDLSPPDASVRYPSPMSSSPPSGYQSPIKLGDPVDDGPRPSKKRKISLPKDRFTAHLDLMKPDDECTDEDSLHLQRLVSALHKKKKIVVVAGAGISVSAGIPDFRSSTGLFASASNRRQIKAAGKHLFDASVYKHASSTHSFHTMVREMAQLSKHAPPTPFHHLLASLAKEGRLLRLYSQNIDCIDTSMEPLGTDVPLEPKGPWPPTIQLHGGLQKMVCTKCGDLRPFNGDLFTGCEAPLCGMCEERDQVRTTYAGKRSHGIGRLRPRFVLYNEYNPDEEAIGNVARADLKARPDAVIVVGTTLKVPGTRRLVKELCQVARGRKDGFTAWINIDPEPKGSEFKDCWDLVVRSECDNVARLASLPPFDCDIGQDYHVSKEQYVQKLGLDKKPTVEIGLHPAAPSALTPTSCSDTKPKLGEAFKTMPTPRPSPPVTSKTTPQKARQSKLPLVRKPAAAKAPSKPRARKAKQDVKARLPPKTSMLHTFKAVKNVAGGDVGKPAACASGPDSFPTDLPRSNPDVDTDRFLPSLRPDKGASSGHVIPSYGPLTGDPCAEKTAVAPSTPPLSDKRLLPDTISPNSVPKSMQDLID